MSKRALTGSRIRERRLGLGRKQGDLARQAGISPSYLNLIEHNRRAIGGKLLVTLAAALEVDPTYLSQGAEIGLLEGLQQAGASQDMDLEGVEDLAGRFPDWSALIAAQHRRIAALEDIVDGLNDRLTHDPVLSEKMHEVLSTVSAIRSTSAILVATPDIDPAWRDRFHANIDRESRRLAGSSAAMAAHFDQLTQEETGFTTALEVLAQFFDAHNHHFPAIEAGGHDGISDVLDNTPGLTHLAKDLVQKALERYADDAVAMPLDQVTSAARQFGYDPAKLAGQFKTDLPAAFRRLACLPLTANTPDIGLVSCDNAGAITFRKTLPSFALPRFGAACPLWPLFEALSQPGRPVRGVIEATTGARFQTYAMAAPQDAYTFDGPVSHMATMVLISLPDTAQDGPARQIGSSCRVCTRETCTARREPSILSH